ncbi:MULTISPECIES: type II toxin-antitoxin system RelE/ParE family toxin [unclassified Sphingomonas]|uniref:type II toxin-antitoxin system RelE/ParE family toxin n=1 Tax=unclassified Sphingomonas TaxID=196159 RepID=UPI0009E041FD
MTRLRTAPATRQDIRDIRGYGKARFGVAVGRQYLEGLITSFDRLAERPQVGVAEAGLGNGIRSFPYRSHRIYYRLEGEDLLVVRILHHSQHVPSAFGLHH